MVRNNKYDISDIRKEELSDLAEFIADEYFPNSIVQPELIVESKKITYNSGNYGHYFNGILEFDNNHFHMYFNKDMIDNIYTPRGRFTVAHELGHYFIDDHRIALESNLTPSHPSFIDFSSNNRVELEADFFASSLLIPRNRLLNDISNHHFSFDLVNELKNKYNTSLTAMLLKFISIGNQPLMIIVSIDAKIRWFKYSSDFPFKSINAIPGFKVPNNTVAGDIFYKNIIEIDSDEIVYVEDWFNVWNNDDKERVFYERCIYSPKNKFVMSIIWEKE